MFEGRNVHFSTDNKPLCSFSGKLCKLRRLNGYAFCVRHILEDPTAPFRQCAYVVKSSGHKCTSAIPEAEERQYCNAHMQVMGFLPKKERKKKVDSLFLADTETGIQSLEKYAALNGLNDDIKLNKGFSASKLFPELAGKLSVDNHSVTNSGQLNTANVSGSESVESVIKENGKILGKSPSKQAVSGSIPRRQKKQTRKFLSIQKKKQLGLLTDEEARAKFSLAGCQAYSHYVKMRTFDSDLLTPLVDSSDDEQDCSSLPTSKYIRSHNLSISDSMLNPLLFSSTLSTDLKTENNEVDPAIDTELLSLKQCCLTLRCSTYLNKDVTEYQRVYMQYLLETLKTDASSSDKLIVQIRKPVKEHSDTQLSTPKGTSDVPKARTKRLCSFTYSETQESCSKPTIPFANHCLSHISQNAEQQLFTHCSLSSVEEDNSQIESCDSMVIDIGHGQPLCTHHTPIEVETDPSDSMMIDTVAPKRTKKKSKSFALLKSNKKKKKKNLRPQKPVPTSSENSKALYSGSSSSHSVTDSTVITKQCEEENSSKNDEPPNTVDGTDERSMSPLDKSLELPLDQADSKLLLEKDFEDVLNDNNFDLFSGKADESLGLTDAEANLFLSATDEAMMEELKSELPDDITDTILHVESEHQAALEQQKHHQQHQHQTIPAQPHIQTNHHMMNSTNNYSLSNSMNHSYSKTEYNNLQSSFNHQGPPPDYPGASSILPPVSHLNPNNHMVYMRDTPTSYQHQLHPKLQQTSTPPHSHMMLNSSSYHMPPSPAPIGLPPSSTLLDNSHHQSTNRMDRLPPVSTITMQQWPASEPSYQNGYHNPPEHLFIQNGLPSPPQYHAPRDQRLIYQSMYNTNPYNLNHHPHPPPPQRINMPLQ